MALATVTKQHPSFPAEEHGLDMTPAAQLQGWSTRKRESSPSPGCLSWPPAGPGAGEANPAGPEALTAHWDLSRGVEGVWVEESRDTYSGQQGRPPERWAEPGTTGSGNWEEEHWEELHHHNQAPAFDPLHIKDAFHGRHRPAGKGERLE